MLFSLAGLGTRLSRPSLCSFPNIFPPVWSVFPTFLGWLLQILQKHILSIRSLEQPLPLSVVWIRHTRLSGQYYPHCWQAVDRGGFARWTVKSYWEGTVLLNLSLVYGKWWMSKLNELWFCFWFWDCNLGCHEIRLYRIGCPWLTDLHLLLPPEVWD